VKHRELWYKIGESVGRAAFPFAVVFCYRQLGWGPLWFMAGAEFMVLVVWVIALRVRKKQDAATPPLAPVVRIPGSGALQ
jgi:hypothetical protein